MRRQNARLNKVAACSWYVVFDDLSSLQVTTARSPLARSLGNSQFTSWCFAAIKNSLVPPEVRSVSTHQAGLVFLRQGIFTIAEPLQVSDPVSKERHGTCAAPSWLRKSLDAHQSLQTWSKYSCESFLWIMWMIWIGTGTVSCQICTDSAWRL